MRDSEADVSIRQKLGTKVVNTTMEESDNSFIYSPNIKKNKLINSHNIIKNQNHLNKLK